MTIGIYILNFEGTDQVYVGQSEVSIEGRLKQHCKDLKNGEANKKMQKYYNEFKIMPTQELLEECSPKDIDKKEISWIAEFDSFHSGFNCNAGGFGGGTGASTYGEDHHASTISNAQTVEVMLQLSTGKGPTEVSNELGVSFYIVRNISCGSTHRTFLSKEYPVEYAAMLAKNGTRTTGCTRNKPCPDVLSPEGTRHKITDSVSGFAKEHGLDRGNFTKLLGGEQKSCKGWTLAPQADSNEEV